MGSHSTGPGSPKLQRERPILSALAVPALREIPEEGISPHCSDEEPEAVQHLSPHHPLLTHARETMKHHGHRLGWGWGGAGVRVGARLPRKAKYPICSRGQQQPPSRLGL